MRSIRVERMKTEDSEWVITAYRNVRLRNLQPNYRVAKVETVPLQAIPSSELQLGKGM
jgi:hypothetical protein